MVVKNSSFKTNQVIEKAAKEVRVVKHSLVEQANQAPALGVDCRTQYFHHFPIFETKEKVTMDWPGRAE